jgi:hypothetical protein
VEPAASFDARRLGSYLAVVLPTLEVVAMCYHQRFCLLTLAEYGRILLDIGEPARSQLRENSGVLSANNTLCWIQRGLQSLDVQVCSSSIHSEVFMQHLLVDSATLASTAMTQPRLY